MTDIIQMLDEYYSLGKGWMPWKAAPKSAFGEDWPVATWSTGTAESGDWHIATDSVRASEHTGPDAEDDARAIAALHNAWPALRSEIERLRKIAGETK